MTDESLKKCQICFKDMDTRARKCPHCQSDQSFFRRWGFVLLIIVILSISTMWDIMSDPVDSGVETFQSHKDEINVTDSKLHFGQTGCSSSTMLIVIGKIKNDSNHIWESLSFEVTYYDKDGNLIDTAQKNDFSFVLPTHEEIPFKLSMQRNFPEADYASHKVRVILASKKHAYY